MLGIDTWLRERTGVIKDAGDASGSARHAHADVSFVGALRPVPILPLDAGQGVYANLPAPARTAQPQRARSRLGLPADAQVVLTCSALWQHRAYPRAAIRRLGAAFPRLLAECLAPHARAHLVHVGPEAWPVGEVLGERYRALPSLPPEAFGDLLAAADLFVSANASATTLVRAMGQGVPALLVWQSEEPPQEPDPALRPYLPLPAYALWPLGWWRFLRPVLEDNAYVRALDPVELTDLPALRDRIARLLHDPQAARAQRERQHDYLAALARLPSGAEAIDQALQDKGATL